MNVTNPAVKDIFELVPGISLNTKNELMKLHLQTPAIRELMGQVITFPNGVVSLTVNHECPVAPPAPPPPATAQRSAEQKAAFRAKQHEAAVRRKADRLKKHEKRMADQAARAALNKQKRADAHAKRVAAGPKKPRFKDAHSDPNALVLRALREKHNTLRKEVHDRKVALAKLTLVPARENALVWTPQRSFVTVARRLDGAIAPLPCQRSYAQVLLGFRGSPPPVNKRFTFV